METLLFFDNSFFDIDLNIVKEFVRRFFVFGLAGGDGLLNKNGTGSLACVRDDASLWVGVTEGTGLGGGDGSFLGTRAWIPPCGRNDAPLWAWLLKIPGWRVVTGF